MLQEFYGWCLTRHKQTRDAGLAIVATGCLLLVLGAIGRVFIVAASFQPSPPDSLAQLKLPFPTFLVPESIFGAAFALGLAAAGFVVVRASDRFKRVYEPRPRRW